MGIGLSATGTYGFSLGNMFSIRHQRRGLETLTTNSWAMLYGTLVMGAIALLRGDNFMPEWTVSYLGALLYGAVRLGHRLWRLFHSWGASAPAKPPSTLLFPLVALSISIVYEGYVWHSNAVIGLALILLGNCDVCQTGTAVAAPKAGLRRLKKQRRRQTALAR